MRRGNRVGRISTATVIALAGIALAAPAANANFHLTKISEVFSDNSAGAGDYIELQMYSPGQNSVAGHYIGIYNAGAPFGSSPYLIPANVPNGDNQRTILIGNTGTTGLSPDFVISNFEIPNSGSACFLQSIMPDVGIDCVSFGESFPGAPSPTGTPTGNIPIGQSLVRSIAPNCSTLLEDADDTNNSSTDFFFASPSPRNNATPPTETACGGGNPGGGPDTKIDKGPKKKTKKKKATFKFSSTTPGATFECSVDGKAFASCASPFKVKVKKGKHEFEVRAVLAGVTDGSPAEQNWKVKKKKK